jgi:DNA uptake protein ComE-like DNA-binding protein
VDGQPDLNAAIFATAAELDCIHGIGPAISTKTLDERKKDNFKDWNDFITRAKGAAAARK